MDKKDNEEASIPTIEKASESMPEHCKAPVTHRIEIQANAIGSRSLLGLGFKSNIIMEALRSKKNLVKNLVLVSLDCQSSRLLYGSSKKLVKMKKKDK